MKLSRLYSNKPDLFEPIDFVSGLNVVLGEIRLPQNKGKDTHNLGKTILGRTLDFCLLMGRDPRFFLFKHLNLFKDFIFFLEVELKDGSHVTIKRGVEAATKISFKLHKKGRQDFTRLPISQWNHQNVAFDRARKLLDGILDWRDVKPWSYRKGLGYLLRTQDDYRDVFHLRKFASKHLDWKPFLAHLLGFDAILVGAHYDKEAELEEKEGVAQTILAELGGELQDSGKVEGILLLKKKEAEKRQALLDSFDFRSPDKDKTKTLVDDINARIADLNSERYYLRQSKKKISDSLKEDRITFDPDEAQRIFEEAGALFPGQIKRDFEQLIAFNKSITEERSAYLREEMEDVDARLKVVGKEINDLGRKRSEVLAFLSETEVFEKYKRLSDEMVSLKADIESLERQREFVMRLRTLRKEIRALKEERDQLQDEIELDVYEKSDDPESLFSSIRLFFSEIVEEVISRKALLSVSVNKVGHLDFRAEILDGAGNATSADLGHTYRKLLCVAFDLAVLRAHANERFPRFAYHDGVFESLDDRKKESLLVVIRRYAGLGLQPIITVIDSDLPERDSNAQPIFEAEEIVKLLHDEGKEGRLFKMPAW